MVELFVLNIWNVYYVLYWITQGVVKFANYCIMCLFTVDRMSQPCWSWGCKTQAQLTTNMSSSFLFISALVHRKLKNVLFLSWGLFSSFFHNPVPGLISAISGLCWTTLQYVGQSGFKVAVLNTIKTSTKSFQYFNWCLCLLC